MDTPLFDDEILLFQIPFRFIHALMEHHTPLAEAGLNKTEVRTLMILYYNAPLSMKMLGHWVGMSKGSLTQVVDKLVRSKMAIRFSNPDDRRMVLVRITQLGKDTADLLNEDLRRYIQSRLEPLSQKELEELKAALHTMYSIITQLQESHHNA